ncbi:trypsin-like peptidase domain-containing protein [Amycolatopsis alba]|uniref:Serine protease n=1 Tax=Amycolatopsis alba DSM 44262 TaxID=1125972 RepID=A0A229SA58_AMYAL|nr:trypsin-like peptidase domain-containing protein [Amycolatopsis alba]OXM55760.1 serine protease [Amycolatopsis alba DSM 44262]
MTPIPDSFPLDWTDSRLQELRNTLSAAIYREREIEVVAIGAGVPPGRIRWGQQADHLWFDVLNEAAAHVRVKQLLADVGERQPALAARIGELSAAAPLLTARIPDDHPPALSPDDVRWKNFGGGNELQVFAGEETLMDVAFLGQGLDRAKSVCRLKVSHGRSGCHGTGFRIGPATVLTSHHVLHDWRTSDRPAIAVQAEFHYELDLTGALRASTVIPCDPASIAGDQAHDFAVITTSAPLPEDVPIVPLPAVTDVKEDDRVYIIQHPRGLPKKIALHHNLVRHVDEDVVQYWTDTETGSSGSPVFDRHWRVVALHHQWVRSTAEDGVAYRNQGRAIGRIVERLRALGLAPDQE